MVQNLVRGCLFSVVLALSAGTAWAQQYAALVMDARTGEVIHSVNADTRVHPASLTKMMTLYVVFDEIRRGRLSLDQKIAISANAASEPPSKLGLKAGSRIELRYLIRAAAIKSANDAATALGEAVAGSESAFAARMDQYARAMGLENTSFKNAHGLTETGHLSTARDMAEIGRRLLYDFPQYYNIFSRNSTSAGLKTVSNTNRRLLDAYEGADGIKTGYTRAAGFNLVSSAQRGDRRVIVALLGGKSSASRNAEVAKLMDLGFSQMPASVQIAAPAPLATATTTVAAASGQRGSTVVVSSGATVARTAATALERAGRPMARAFSAGTATAIARNSESIAAAIAEVNAELAAAVVGGRESGRPAPRPGTAAAAASVLPTQSASLASTFASAPAPFSAPRTVAEPDQELVAASSGTGTTGGNDWGVQIGAFRSRGDAERQLLTTALKDVPELSGGLRRVEAAKLQGTTIYRAQFVGLNESEAQAACQALARIAADCLPLAPGI